MKDKQLVFVDSDVIISSLISKSGASFLLLYKTAGHFYISNVSRKEIAIVAKRLKILFKKNEELIPPQIHEVKLSKTLSYIKKAYGTYVKDIHDAHIVAGTIASKSRFLMTYNLKHFHQDKIKQDFNIIILTPGQYLQYLRSLS